MAPVNQSALEQHGERSIELNEANRRAHLKNYIGAKLKEENVKQMYANKELDLSR